jgi:hypothetical protein
MRYNNHPPRKGELNHKLQKIMLRCFKKWNVREANVNYDAELVPHGGSDWEVTGKYRPFVEFIKVEAFRRRPNRTIAEHKVCLCSWPVTPSNLPKGESNPTVSSVVNDPWWIELSVHRKTNKVLGT